MAGLGRKTFVGGTKLLAADVNGYLQDQVVMVFADASTRDSVVTPSEGMVAYLKDTNAITSYDGSNWVTIALNGAWTAYTPTLSNLTLGNGTLSFAYQQSGKTINVRGRFTLGSTSAVSGSAQFSLPVTPTSYGFGAAQVVAAGANYPGLAFISGSNVVVSVFNAAGTYATRQSTSGTIPGTFTTGDSIAFSFTYEAA